jgi:hypothetical protein
MSNENIAILEARAFLLAVKALPPSNGCMLRMMIDNTTVVGSIHNTRSRNFTINRVVGVAMQLAKTKGYTLRAEYVESLGNLADNPSRCGRKIKALIPMDWEVPTDWTEEGALRALASPSLEEENSSEFNISEMSDFDEGRSSDRAGVDCEEEHPVNEMLPRTQNPCYVTSQRLSGGDQRLSVHGALAGQSEEKKCIGKNAREGPSRARWLSGQQPPNRTRNIEVILNGEGERILAPAGVHSASLGPRGCVELGSTACTDRPRQLQASLSAGASTHPPLGMSEAETQESPLAAKSCMKGYRIQPQAAQLLHSDSRGGEQLPSAISNPLHDAKTSRLSKRRTIHSIMTKNVQPQGLDKKLLSEL